MTQKGIQPYIKSLAKDLSYAWTPVLRPADQRVRLGADLGKLLVEEVAFFPSKVWTLLRVHATKNKTDPSIWFLVYMAIVVSTATIPILLLQSVTTQVCRAFKGLFLVLTGRVTYKVKAKNE